VSYHLEYAGEFTRRVRVGIYDILTRYAIWNCFKGDCFLGSKSLTADCYLNKFLEAIREGNNIPLNETQYKIINCCFSHTSKWKPFYEAKKVLIAKGREEALKYLEEQFSVVFLGDQLEPKGDRR